MTYQKSYHLFNHCLILGFVIIALNTRLDIWWLFLVGFAIIVGGAKQVSYFCRCPHCDGVLDVRRGKDPLCHHCNGTLDW